MEPERPGSGPPVERSSLSPEEQRRIVRAAALRPLNVIVLVIGAGVFATTLAWWMLALTLLTYAALVALAARDPSFGRRVLGPGGSALAGSNRPGRLPDRRARWLPRGEAREKVEAALVVYRKVVVAIEESDEVTRAVLDDAIPKLHAAANRLVDVAEKREKAAEVLNDLERHAGTASSAGGDDVEALRDRVSAADAEISETFDKMLALRSRVVRVSIDSGNPEGAAALNASLDDLNARLEALSETMSPPEAPTPER